MVNRQSHVLIADDDKDDHEFLQMAIGLAPGRYRSTCVFDGAELLEYLTQKGRYQETLRTTVDLIILDVDMPLVNGVNALSQIVKDAAINHIPVFMLSNFRSEKTYKACMVLGAKGYYMKPDNIPAYKDILDEMCARTFHFS